MRLSPSSLPVALLQRTPLAKSFQDPESIRIAAKLARVLDDEDFPKELHPHVILARETYVALRNAGKPAAEALTTSYGPLTQSSREFLSPPVRKRQGAAKVEKAGAVLPVFDELCSGGVSPQDAVIFVLSPSLRAAWGGLEKGLVGDGATETKGSIKRAVIELISVGERESDLLRYIEVALQRATLPAESQATLSKLAVKRQETQAKIAAASSAAERQPHEDLLRRIDATQVFYIDLCCALRASEAPPSANECDTRAAKLAGGAEGWEAMAKVLALADSIPRADVRRRLRDTFVEYVLRSHNPAEAATTACEEFREGSEDGNLHHGGRGGNGSRGGGLKGTGSSEQS